MPRTVRLGMFVVGALGMLALAIFLIGRRQGIFRSGYTLKAAFTNVSGLQNGAEVRVGGISEGTVKVIQLPAKPGDKIMVVMELAKPTRNVIRKDSVGAIRTEGMVGAEFVEISFGSADYAPVEDGDTIQSEPPIDFSDLLKKTNTILDSTQSLTSSLSSAAQNLDAISAKINGGRGSLGALVNDKQIYNQLTATTAQAEAGAAAFKDNMQALQHNFLLRGFFNKRGYHDSAELTAHAVDSLPDQPYVKRFSYDARQLFDKPGGVKLKSSKALDDAGHFLQSDKFGTAVIVAYTGGKGDSEKDQTLTEVRSTAVRDYLVKNFSIANDTQLKTMGVGKDGPGEGENDGIEILVYPPGSEVHYANAPDISGHHQ